MSDPQRRRWWYSVEGSPAVGPFHSRKAAKAAAKAAGHSVIQLEYRHDDSRFVRTWQRRVTPTWLLPLNESHHHSIQRAVLAVLSLGGRLHP